jgi:hypothetical protein
MVFESQTFAAARPRYCLKPFLTIVSSDETNVPVIAIIRAGKLPRRFPRQFKD